MKSLRVGVVGLGLGRIYAEAFDQSNAVESVAVCDTDKERVKAVRASLPKAGGAYGTLEEMLDAQPLDALSIVTPDHLHRPQAEAALAAGCHVLIAKPLATNLEDARAIIHAAESRGRKLMVAHERRFHHPEQRIKTILDSGDLGEIIHLRIDSYHYKAEQFRRSPWYASSETGRTAMVGTAIHEVDLMRYLTGQRIKSVFAFGNRTGSLAFPGDKTVATVCRMERQTVGQVTVSYESRRGVNVPIFCLLATKGMIVGDRVIRDDGSAEILPSDENGIVIGTRGCVTRFVDAIVHDTPVAVSGRDAFASLAACVAADESCQRGGAVVPALESF